MNTDEVLSRASREFDYNLIERNDPFEIYWMRQYLCNVMVYSPYILLILNE